MSEIAERVAVARRGENPTVIAKLHSGWAVMSDRQFPRGWCVLLADPVVGSLNDLDPAKRPQFLTDMARLGDAVLAVTGALRINYAMYGNQAPQLHAHVIPRHADEPADMKPKPVWLYPAEQLDSRPFDPERDGPMMARLREHLDGSA